MYKQDFCLQQHKALLPYSNAVDFHSEVEYYRDILRIAPDTISLYMFSSLRSVKAALSAAFTEKKTVKGINLHQESSCLKDKAEKMALAMGIKGKNEVDDVAQVLLSRLWLCSDKTEMWQAGTSSRVIGDLINSASKSRFHRMFHEGAKQELKDLLIEQKGNGAAILGLSLDESLHKDYEAYTILVQLLAEVDLPLLLDVECQYQLIELLASVPGRNLVLCKQAHFANRDSLYKLCLEYAAGIVLSPVINGVYTREDCLLALNDLVEEALNAGLSKNAIVLEVPTMAVLSMPLLLEETLATISLVKQNLIYPIMISLSQVSQNMLIHGWSNAYYAACAIDRGATLLLANSAQREVMNMVRVANELRGGELIDA